MKETLATFISKFNVFTEEEIQAIVDNTKVEFFKKGTVILKEGEVCTKCYFVLSGCVRQYQLVDGEEKTNAFFLAEEAAVLYKSYLNKLPSDHYLSCVEDSVLITGTREEEEKLHLQYPKLSHMVHTLMQQDYSKIEERLTALINYNPEERYLMLMQTQPELMNRVPLHQLASYIGVTPESFSRIRKRVFQNDKSI